MTSAPTVSVALATYNGARFLKEQLQSLAAQTLLPAELVVTDDGSSDETLAIVEAFAATVPFPVRIEKNSERLGYRANFMKAASLCQSDFIAFCDQDDIWLPRKLETCIKAFVHEDVLLVYHNATVVTETLVPCDSFDIRDAPATVNGPLSLSPWHFGLGFTQVFRRSLLAFNDAWPASVDFIKPDEREAHDLWFFFLASSLGSIGYIKEPLALHRQHGTNTCGWDSRPKLVQLWSNIMLPGTLGFTARALCAGKRVAFLEDVGGKLGGERESRATRAAAGYRKLETMYRSRVQMYRAGNVFARLSRLIELMRSGTYRSGKEWGGIGPKALARDIIRGLLLPARETPVRETR